jgi:hypothetical protein
MIKILQIIGWLIVGAMVLVCLFVAILMHQLSKCGESDDAYAEIAEVLTPAQATTLKRIATEGDSDVECSLWFSYTKNGKAVEVSALADVIHGTKYGSSDDGETANAIYQRRHMRH